MDCRRRGREAAGAEALLEGANADRHAIQRLIVVRRLWRRLLLA